MSSTLIVPFTTNSNYTKSDDTLIEADGNATLILEDSDFSFSEDYADDTGFTYDSDNTEFSGGKVQQKIYDPEGVSCYSTFNQATVTEENMSFPTLTYTGTYSNSSVTAGVLDLTTGNDSTYCSYNVGNLLDASPNTLTIAVELDFNYSGSPTGFQRSIFTNNTGSRKSLVNKIHVRHLTSGQLQLELWDKDGIGRINAVGGSFSPVAGTKYTIKVQISSGASSLWVDETQISSSSATFVRDLTGVDSYITLGTSVSGYVSSYNMYNFIIYSTATATIDWDILRDNCYEADKIDYTFSYPNSGNIQSFNSFTSTDTNTPKYLLNDNYWNGSIWTTSDGTYSQSSSISDINTNISSLNASDTLKLSIITDGGCDQMSVDLTAIGYTGQAYSTDSPYIEFNTANNMSSLLTFVESPIISGSDVTKYTVVVDNVSKYWNGSAWATSSGYSQSNTAAEINTNGPTLLSARSSVKIRTYLYSDDGTTTPTVDYISYSFDAALPDPTNLPRLVDINGFVYNMNAAVSGQEIKARPYQHGYQNPNDGVGGGVFQKYDYQIIATTDSNGFFSGSIYLQPTAEYIEFRIGKQSYYTQLPDQDAVDFNTLTLVTVV